MAIQLPPEGFRTVQRLPSSTRSGYSSRCLRERGVLYGSVGAEFNPHPLLVRCKEFVGTTPIEEGCSESFLVCHLLLIVSLEETSEAFWFLWTVPDLLKSDDISDRLGPFVYLGISYVGNGVVLMFLFSVGRPAYCSPRVMFFPASVLCSPFFPLLRTTRLLPSLLLSRFPALVVYIDLVYCLVPANKCDSGNRSTSLLTVARWISWEGGRP